MALVSYSRVFGLRAIESHWGLLEQDETKELLVLVIDYIL